MIVTNNQYGISTPAATQHGEKLISDRAHAFGIQTAHLDGNDPEASYRGLKKAMDYVRTRAASRSSSRRACRVCTGTRRRRARTSSRTRWTA